MSRVPETQTDALPRVGNIAATLSVEAPKMTIEALFPDGATGTDVFVDNPHVLVSVPKPLGPLEDGKQVFEVTFFSGKEAEALKGKPLTLTLVSNQGSSQTTWTAE